MARWILTSTNTYNKVCYGRMLSASAINTEQGGIIKANSHLIAITPWEVLASNILVRVLCAFFEWRHVVPMVPMLVPEVVSIDSGKDQAGRDHAIVW